MKKLLLGNEAIARGAYEAGVRVSSAYPGTPSTEINENVATYPEIYSEWAPNEKVAVEVALGAAVSGARSLACMKHVGLNVAADPFFTATYTGVNAGMVVVVADDPGMHSSQNEQDTRMLARASHAPVLDPSNSQECKDFLKLAYEISEKYDTPVILRVTTRIAHARTLVELDERVEVPLREYKRDIKKYVSMPANMIARHLYVEEREKKLAEDANTLPINRIEWADRKIGVITSGAAYNYVKEAMPTASVLKLGLAYPMPRKLIEEFAAGVDTLYVIEDMEPFYEDTIKSWGIKCSGKDRTGVQGELFARKIANKFNGEEEAGPMNTQGIPMRPPVLCPGCPHRGLYYVLGKLKLTVCSDIGCYTLGALPPLSGVDTCVCMDKNDQTACFVNGNTLLIDLGEERTITSFHYLPDQSEYNKGVIAAYEISVGMDSNAVNQVVAKDEFSNIKNNPILQSVYFTPLKARYVQLKATRMIHDGEPLGLAEIGIQ